VKKKIICLIILICIIYLSGCGVSFIPIGRNGDNVDTNETDMGKNNYLSENAFNLSDLSGLIFYHASGVGAWHTEAEIFPDGNFSGYYGDSDMGDTGNGYPNGTHYECYFDGQFSSPVKTGEYEYTMTCKSLTLTGTLGEEKIIDGIRYITAEPAGFAEENKFILYLPGKKANELPEGFLDWIKNLIDIENTETIDFYGLYNVTSERGGYFYENYTIGVENTEKPSGDIGDIKVRWDEEELVMIRIINGEPELTFAFDRWAELHDLFNYIEKNYPYVEVPVYGNPIIGPSGRLTNVKDACVGKIEALDSAKHDGFIIPSVILLMEDGTIEWVLADPFVGMQFSYGKLPWLNNIVSLSYEQESDGRGDMTIYATDADGLRYDVRIPCGLYDIFEDDWYCELSAGENYGIFLSFEENGGVTLMKGWLQSEAAAIYNGTYTVSLSENVPEAERPGMISFDLSLDFSDYDFPEKIQGMYYISASWGISMELYLSGGDTLHDGMAGYTFLHMHSGVHEDYDDEDWDGSYNAGRLWVFHMTDDDFINYLLDNVPEAYERVKVMRNPMAVLITGATTELPDEGTCRDICLGTDQSEHFVVEIIYTVSDSGLIYEFDPVNNVWNCVYNPFAVG